jgi:hypothetical protein
MLGLFADLSGSRKCSLIFELDKDSVLAHSDVSDAMETLIKLKKASSPSVKAEAPALFVELIEALRQLNTEGLQKILRNTEEAPERKVLMDAIPLVNSDFSLPFLRDMYFRGEVNDEQFNSWLSSVAFIKDPSSPMIASLLVSE